MIDQICLAGEAYKYKVIAKHSTLNDFHNAPKLGTLRRTFWHLFQEYHIDSPLPKLEYSLHNFGKFLANDHRRVKAKNGFFRGYIIEIHISLGINACHWVVKMYGTTWLTEM